MTTSRSVHVSVTVQFCSFTWLSRPAPVFLPGESQGQGSLLGCRLTPVFLPGESQGWGSLLGCRLIPVFLPGESQGQESLLGCHLWGRTESDTTEVT